MNYITLITLFNIRTAWNDYFTGTPTRIQKSEYLTRQNYSDTSVHVSNCLFRSITSISGSGGALSCTSVTYLLVESTSFFSCNKNYSSGGAIYFSNSKNSECVLHEVCGYDCYSTYSSYSTGQFAQIKVYNGILNKNYVDYSSISRCVNTISNAWSNLNLRGGKVCCSSVNMSMNKCDVRPAIDCDSYGSSDSPTCSVTFSSFADNIAIRAISIFFSSGGSAYVIKSCNIIRNSNSEISSGIVHSWKNLTIEDSCIIENNANIIFSVASTFTITLSGCTLDKTTSSGTLTIQNTVTKSFVLALNHMSTRNCPAENDYLGMSIVFIQPLSFSNNQKLCHTRERFFYKLPPQTFFVSFYFSV
jgi:hypothetical protein